MKFSIKSSGLENDALKVDLVGDLFGELNQQEFISFIQKKVDSGVLYYVFDLSDLRYLDSSGIGLLITCLTKFRNKGGELVLLNPSNKLKELLAMTKLEAIFKIERKIEDAVSHFN